MADAGGGEGRGREEEDLAFLRGAGCFARFAGRAGADGARTGVGMGRAQSEVGRRLAEEEEDEVNDEVMVEEEEGRADGPSGWILRFLDL